MAAEETYELCLDGEGLRIIPVGDDQVSVHILAEDPSGAILTGDQVGILGGQEDPLDKSLATPLFLSPPQSLLEPRVQQTSLEKKSILQSISLYIEYGANWIEDILQGMGEVPTLCDFPVYCTDGISWSSRIILGSLNAKLRNLLLSAGEDSCLLLPQISKDEFDTFMMYILQKDPPISKVAMKKLLKVGEFFEFPIRYISLEDQTLTQDGMISYKSIFTQQREEFIHKLSRQADLAKFISEVVSERVPTVPNVESPTWNQHNVVNSDTSEELRVDCSECQRVFPSEEALSVHTSIVHAPKQPNLHKAFQCPCCTKMFRFKQNVGRHVKLVHRRSLEQVLMEKRRSESPILVNPVCLSPPSSPPSQLPPPQPQSGRAPKQSKKERVKKGDINCLCNICGIYAKNKRALVQHMQKHYGRLYKCEVQGCSASFTERSKLTRHMVVHTREKKFQCPQCFQKFTLCHNMKTHMKMHARDLGKVKKDSFPMFTNPLSAPVLMVEKQDKKTLQSEAKNPTPVELSDVDLAKTSDEIEKFIAAMEGEQI